MIHRGESTSGRLRNLVALRTCFIHRRHQPDGVSLSAAPWYSERIVAEGVMVNGRYWVVTAGPRAPLRDLSRKFALQPDES